MKTLDVHHTAAFCGVKLPAHHRCVYIYHLWNHKHLSTVVIIKYQNKICLHGKKLHTGQSFIQSKENQTNQLSSAHFINCTNGYFKFLAVWWIKVRSLPCQKVPSDRVTSKTEGKGEKQTCGYRMSWSGSSGLCFAVTQRARNVAKCVPKHWYRMDTDPLDSTEFFLFFFKVNLSNKSFTASEN